MSAFPTQGAALRKIIDRSKTRSINFGFNPGTDDDDHYFAADIIKSPEFLGKHVRNEGLGAKIAYGVFTTRGNVITLQCTRAFPTLRRLFLRLLRQNDIGLTVEVVETAKPQGNSDTIENDEDGDGQSTPDGDETRRMRGLAARFQDLQPRIAATPPQIQARLSDAMKAVAIALREGDGAGAEARLARIDAVFRRFEQGDDAAQEKWEKAVEVLEARVKASETEELRVQWYRAVRMADDGAYVRALAELPRIIAQLKAETQD
ncbi:MAG: hypothetical protein ACK5M4_01525 [Pseudorhodobacter sp.]